MLRFIPLRKKGGIIIKKHIFFLILLCAIMLSQCFIVQAKDIKFIEAEYIDGIWMNRIFSTDLNTIHYQKARVFRQADTNRFVYCIEPTTFFDSSAIYKSKSFITGLSTSQMERMKALAHYGYQYKDHTDMKWYAITQLLIWKEADPLGDYYFTNGLNGERINLFQEEINELNALVDKDLSKPNLNSITTVREGKAIINDSNSALYKYSPSMGTIIDNSLVLDDLTEGSYNITLTKKDTFYNSLTTFYYSENSQNIIAPGDYEETIYIKVNITKTSLTIHKVDKETKDYKGQGNAKIEGTVYTLFDKDNNKVNDLVIDENGNAQIENLDFGTYYLKETIPGEGYQLDQEVYTINIDDKNPKITLQLEDELIKKEIVLHKTFGDGENFTGEKDILFSIYDENNQLLDTIKTDENGYAYITLKYGNYKIVQQNTTNGYKMIEPIEITIEDEKDNSLLLDLKDQIIKKEIVLHKTFGDGENFIGEKDITFYIYDNDNHLIDSIKTDEDGYAYITLKYGNYKIIQQNTTEGYKMIEPITINVEDEDTTYLELKDYKIEVPNTGVKETFKEKLIRFLLSFICQKNIFIV